MKNIKQRIGTGIVLVSAGLASLLNSGCEMTPAQSMAIGGASAQNIGATNPNLSYQQAQSLGAMGGLLGVLSHQEAMKEAAEAGKSETVVNVNVPQQQNYQHQANIQQQTAIYSTAKQTNKGTNEFGVPRTGIGKKNDIAIILCNTHIDLNKDRFVEENEIFGLNKKIYDLDKEIITMCFYNEKRGKFRFSSFTQDGRLIGETEREVLDDTKGLICYFTEPNGPTGGDFMDNLRGAGPGDYRIIAVTENGESIYQDLTLVRNKN